MKTQDLHCQISVVISLVVLIVSADVGNEYENKLTKLWSLTSSSRSDGARTAVVNVTSASILIEPTYEASEPTRTARKPKMQVQLHPYTTYAFKPRAIPLRRDEPSQVERSIHYTDDSTYKSDVLLPGNYFPIAEVKRKNLSEETYNPLAGGTFHPKIIPLLRSEYERRSLDEDVEPEIEKPDGYKEDVAQSRSWSTIFGEDEDSKEAIEDDDEEDAEYEERDGAEAKKKTKPKGTKLKPKKYAKYMLPLLLAYKLKFFAMIPMVIGGLVLLVGATGLAGFFFALFAATMGLQKGSY